MSTKEYRRIRAMLKRAYRGRPVMMREALLNAYRIYRPHAQITGKAYATAEEYYRGAGW
jgi:hypothetical protein